MSSDIQQIRIGLTNNHPCSYLADRMERVAVAIDPQMQTPETYEVLMANGFRRSGDTIYKPHCDHCQSCQALRIPAPDFVPSKSQKRLLKLLSQEFHWQLKPDWMKIGTPFTRVIFSLVIVTAPCTHPIKWNLPNLPVQNGLIPNIYIFIRAKSWSRLPSPIYSQTVRVRFTPFMTQIFRSL
ncbi:arginyl-tRNA-protein transferase-related protein [Vibrio cholerae]|nr:arginyl-tRNA-protein transferase-related protein [Vibrio cholerae]